MSGTLVLSLRAEILEQFVKEILAHPTLLSCMRTRLCDALGKSDASNSCRVLMDTTQQCSRWH